MHLRFGHYNLSRLENLPLTRERSQISSTFFTRKTRSNTNQYKFTPEGARLFFWQLFFNDEIFTELVGFCLQHRTTKENFMTLLERADVRVIEAISANLLQGIVVVFNKDDSQYLHQGLGVGFFVKFSCQGKETMELQRMSHLSFKGPTERRFMDSSPSRQKHISEIFLSPQGTFDHACGSVFVSYHNLHSPTKELSFSPVSVSFSINLPFVSFNFNFDKMLQKPESVLLNLGSCADCFAELRNDRDCQFVSICPLASGVDFIELLNDFEHTFEEPLRHHLGKYNIANSLHDVAFTVGAFLPTLIVSPPPTDLTSSPETPINEDEFVHIPRPRGMGVTVVESLETEALFNYELLAHYKNLTIQITSLGFAIGTFHKKISIPDPAKPRFYRIIPHQDFHFRNIMVQLNKDADFCKVNLIDNADFGESFDAAGYVIPEKTKPFGYDIFYLLFKPLHKTMAVQVKDFVSERQNRARGRQVISATDFIDVVGVNFFVGYLQAWPESKASLENIFLAHSWMTAPFVFSRYHKSLLPNKEHFHYLKNALERAIKIAEEMRLPH